MTAAGTTQSKLGQPSKLGTTYPNWDSPPTRDVPQGTGTAHLAWDSSLQSGMTHSWDNPAKLGHPSQNGTTQPNWDSPPMWDVPHRVGRLNRLGRPMKEWDDPAVGHPTPSPGHTTQAGTSHTNWSIPFFSRLLSLVPGQVVSRFTLNPSSTRLKISVRYPDPMSYVVS